MGSCSGVDEIFDPYLGACGPEELVLAKCRSGGNYTTQITTPEVFITTGITTIETASDGEL